MYAGGQGVPQDYKEAVRWYRLSAEQGNTIGQYNLGSAYATGEGITRNYFLAQMWLIIAAAAGEEAAINNRDFLAKRMTADQLEQARVLAQRCQQSNFKNCDL
jgi:uncharacterized protein